MTLRSAGWAAGIDPLGAQLSLWRDPGGQDLLWNGDPAFWSGRAPVLFPIVGALNGGHYVWRGQRYALPRHGLARTRRFEIVEAQEDAARFRLRADADTLKIYPFQFELDLCFRIEGPQLIVEAIAHNKGDEPMPASLGFHPAFRWPLPGGAPRGAHFIQFAQNEPAPIRRLDAQGLLTDAQHLSPVRGRRMALDDSLFVDDVIIFDALVSRELSYGTENGPRINMSFPGATHLGLWTKPGAGFLCIEPWRGVADPADYAGDLEKKPGVFIVPPGGSESLIMGLQFEGA